MTYVFTCGERVELVPVLAAKWLHSHGEVLEWLPHSGPNLADGTKANMVRVKLDKVARPKVFRALDLNPL